MDSENDSDSDSDELQTPVETPPSAGALLKAAREKSGSELSDIAAETRIPIRHLEAIEQGDYAALPSRTYAIGFTRTYAKAVGLDERQLTDKVREELTDGHARQSAMRGGMEPGDSAKIPSAGLAWAGAIAAVILAAGVFAFFSNYFGMGAVPGSLVAEQEEVVPVATEGAVAANGATDAAPTAEGQVVFTALEDGIWVRFYEQDGDPLFEAQMASGETFELPSDATNPMINTGRPDAFAITIDGKDVPKLAEEPITMGNTPISAAALLARADPIDQPQAANN